MRRATRIIPPAYSRCTGPLPTWATKTTIIHTASSTIAPTSVRFMALPRAFPRGDSSVTPLLDVSGPRCIVVGGTEKTIIEPTGSIVDPDTVTDVTPPRGEDRRHSEGPVIRSGLQ